MRLLGFALSRSLPALLFAVPRLLSAQPSPGTGDFLVWTVPGTVNADGLNNTRFVSDLALTNPGTTPAIAIVSFVPANGTTAAFVPLNAGETIVYRNVLDRLWAAQGAGATQIVSTSSLLIRARTYNTAATGTYGVALPVFADDRLLSPGEVAHSLWISQSADGNSGYRTNVAVVFPDGDGGAAKITVYDANGTNIGAKDFSLDSAGFQQVSVGSFAGAVPIGRAQLEVTRGRAAGYSVVVDNVTGDSSLFTFEDQPAGVQDVLVNGVARANGRNDTFFRTDGRFYNPSNADATVTVSFHNNQDSNPSPLTRTFTVPAGRIRDVVDVLDSLLGLPVGSAGALRFTSDAPVAILCRTSNVDPAGIRPGTFGAQQKPTPLQSFLMSADAGAVITGIRQNAAFRTNVGFAAGPEGADYALTLKDTAGATVATSTASLGVFGWRQPNVQDLFPGSAIPADASLEVKVNSGSLDVFDSSIDNASGDSVVMPIMPLPVDIPASATIGSKGGSIRSLDGKLTLKVPAGALAAPTSISLLPVANSAPNGRGSAYTISPGGLAFARPARFVLSYSAADFVGAVSGTAGLLFRNGASWYPADRPSLDTAQRTLTASLTDVASLSSKRTSRTGPAGFFDEVALSHAIALFMDSYVVPTGASLRVELSVVLQLPGRPVIKGELSDYVVEWFANEVPFGNAVPVATYQAPNCVPADNPVRIRAILDKYDGKIYGYDIVARVGVVPRDWEFDYSVNQDLICQPVPGTSASISYAWGSKEVARFSISDDLEIVGFQEVSAVVTRREPTMCGGPCSRATMAAFEAMSLLDVEKTSSVNAADAYEGLQLRFSYVIGSPAFTLYCPSGTSNAPGSPRDVFPRQFGIPWKGTTRTLTGPVGEEVLNVRPLTPNCQ